MSWGGIVGQGLAVRLLQKATVTGRVSHAYLFAGPDGVGKKAVALELAKALNCQHPGPDGSACDQCAACRRIGAVPISYPDVTLLSPDGRFIKTDQVRELQAEMYARPSEGKVRIGIVDGADRMNPESGNRLLKLLEEPPAHAVLILLTSNLSGVLPTLISRCQVVNFPPLSSEDIARVLAERQGVEPGRAYLLASLSGGSIGRAARLAEDDSIMERREASGALLEKLADMDDLDALQAAEALEKGKEHLDDWLDMTTAWLRDGLLAAEGAPAGLRVNRDKPGRVEGLAEEYDSPALLAMLGVLTDARSQLQKNANTRLALDVMCLRLGEIARAVRST